MWRHRWGEAYDFGSVPVGSAADVVFRLTNTGAQIYLTNLSVAGSRLLGGVFLISRPVRERGIAAIAHPDRVWRHSGFHRTVSSAWVGCGHPANANMTISAGNTITTILLAEIVPGLSVLLGNRALAAGQTVGFGSVQIGSSQTLATGAGESETNALLAVPSIPPLTG